MNSCVKLKLRNRNHIFRFVMYRVRRVGAIQNQLKHEAIRNRNIRHMLNEHMGYIADAYKPEEVEAVCCWLIV